jgi:exosortase/archaeosortase family protein
MTVPNSLTDFRTDPDRDLTFDHFRDSEIGGGLVISSPDPLNESIRIVFACTAALAMFLFAAAILATRTDRAEWIPWARKELKRTKGTKSLWVRSKRWGILNTMRMSDLQRKVTALMIVVPLIFVVNIFRNVGVILAVHGDLMSFYMAHNVVAKALSLFMMMYLTWILFEYLPELQENMVGLFDLRLRSKKGMIKNGRVDLKFVTPLKKGQDP